jgi:hypothetical protein
MACNPPYARGLTGQWDKCRFPGVLRQDCYDYINLNYDCSGKPDCPDRVVVIEVCDTNAARDDNIRVTLNGTVIADVLDFSKDERNGYFLISDPDATLEASESSIPSCHGTSPGLPISVKRFSPDSIKGGINTINVKIVQQNNNGNAGAFNVRSYVKRNGKLICGCSIQSNITYGAEGDYTFTYDNCCGTNEVPSCPCPTDSGSFSAGLGSCERIDNVSKVTNKFKTQALLEATGGANDEVIINGQIYQARQFPFNWSSFGVCGSADGDNGGHAWSYSKILQPNESVTFGGKDNGYGGEVNGSWTLKTTDCANDSTGSNKCYITAQLRTTGCCLELVESTGRMYAVGAGIVSARVTSGLNSKCCPDFKLNVNGKRWSNTVQDGAPITIEVDSKCMCAKKKPWRTPGGFKPSPCHKGPAPTPGPLRILKNTETGVYQIQLNLNTNSSQNDCGCG